MSKDQFGKNFFVESSSGHHGFKKFDKHGQQLQHPADSISDVRSPSRQRPGDDLRVRPNPSLQDSPPSMSGPGGLMQHQQQRHRLFSQQQRISALSDQGQSSSQHHRQLSLSGSMGQHGQQVYGDPGDYLRLASGQSAASVSGISTNSSLLGLDPSLGVGPPYDEIDLTDPETTNALLMRNDLMASSDSLIHQREQDLNLVSSTPQSIPSSTSSLPVPGFLVPNRSLLAARSGLLGSQDPLAMLFDQPPLPHASGYNTSIDSTHATFTSSSSGLLSSTSTSNFLMEGGSGGLYSGLNNVGPTPSLNGNIRDSGSSNGGGRRPNHHLHQQQDARQHPLTSSSPFLIKQEADEGNFVDEEDSLGHSSINSPTKSDAGNDSRLFTTPSGSDDRKRGIKRTLSNCSASSTGGGNDDPKTSKTPPSSQTQSGRNGGGPGGSEAMSPGTSGDNSKSPTNGTDNLKERDPAYLEKRRKNNESAKRSREARRTKEELVAFKVINLEEENMKLRAEIRLLDKELDELRTRLYQCN